MMKVKIEFTNGSKVVAEAVRVTIHQEGGTVFITCNNSLHNSKYNLEKLSRITVDNEIIYDFMGREERYEKGER